MQKKTVFVLLFILTGILLAGCAPVPPMQTGNDYWPPETKYTVYGRVTNFQHQAVPNCKVVLVRRATDNVGMPADSKVEAEYLVGQTSKTGDYSFEFEPWKAYDVWLYFDAMEYGYEPQIIQLNSYMRSLIGRGWGKSPIHLSVLLEPAKD